MTQTKKLTVHEQQRVELSIIIPAYNEISLIAKSVHETLSFLSRNFPNSELLIVDDGSTDGTVAAVFEFIKTNPYNIHIEMIENKGNFGKGFSIKNGVMSSRGEVIVFTDADLPYDLSSLKMIVPAIQSGIDMMAGSRVSADSVINAKVPLPRKIFSYIYQLFVKFLFNIGITDTQCGFKGFSQPTALAIFSKTQINGFGFDIESFVLARKYKYRVETFPVILNTYREESRINFVKDIPKMIYDLLRVKINLMFGTYDRVE
ncbi:MAG: glycosyltransferase [Anaerolineae bacterium]|nr:glycosyltransferase [Anaerolineae bacterium]